MVWHLVWWQLCLYCIFPFFYVFCNLLWINDKGKKGRQTEWRGDGGLLTFVDFFPFLFFPFLFLFFLFVSFVFFFKKKSFHVLDLFLCFFFLGGGLSVSPHTSISCPFIFILLLFFRCSQGPYGHFFPSSSSVRSPTHPLPSILFPFFFLSGTISLLYFSQVFFLSWSTAPDVIHPSLGHPRYINLFETILFLARDSSSGSAGVSHISLQPQKKYNRESVEKRINEQNGFMSAPSARKVVLWHFAFPVHL